MTYHVNACTRAEISCLLNSQERAIRRRGMLTGVVHKDPAKPMDEESRAARAIQPEDLPPVGSKGRDLGARLIRLASQRTAADPNLSRATVAADLSWQVAQSRLGTDIGVALSDRTPKPSGSVLLGLAPASRKCLNQL